MFFTYFNYALGEIRTPIGRFRRALPYPIRPQGRYGSGRIRTHGRFPYKRLVIASLKPLSHTSNKLKLTTKPLGVMY